MAYYITWLIGAILIAQYCGNAMMAVVPENEEALRAVSNGLKEFSSNFYQTAIGGTNNFICSQLSAGIVLSMAAYGARGNTEKEMKSGLHLPENNSVGRSGYRSLIDTLNNVKKINLKLANKIFLGKGIELKPDYNDVTKNDFKSTAQIVDFDDGAQAAGIINSWCAEKTNDRIRDVVSPDDVQNAIMVMVNAVYFKGNWASPFEDYMTQSKPFYVDENTTKDVDTMYQQSRFNYGALPELDATFVELPYEKEDENDATSMFIILPNEITGLKKTEESLPKLNLKDHHDNRNSVLLNLWLPKFKIESTIDVNKILTNLGMIDMFTNHANFSGITDDPPLKVSKVIQKAFIEVDEKGSEAAAVTTIISVGITSVNLAPRPLNVKIDHPFAFVLYHRATDTILFQGHVTLPSK